MVRVALGVSVLLAGLATALVPGCFRGADVSKIVCDDTKYCPAGYACVVPPGQDRGSCQRVVDAGELDGPGALDGPPTPEAALPVDVAALPDGAVDHSGTAVDQALPVGVDSGAAMDARLGPDTAAVDATVDVATALDTAPPDAPIKLLGVACQSGGECSSSYCVDGICCDGACAGQCQACAEPGSVGTCTTVGGVPRGARPPCGAAQPACAGQCGGRADTCTYPGSDLVCSPATCANDTTLKSAAVCDGTGACSAGSTASCGSGNYCAAGACLPQVANGGACQGPSQCASGNCSNGLCCASGLVACGSTCVSLSTSSANCGSCGRSCATGSSCSGGSCYLNDGQACTTGGQCRSGVCSRFYPDGDGDGYGVGTGVSQCGTTVPADYANQAGDCCDSDANAHPGQTAYFTTAGGCGSFDYNCDGQATPKSNGLSPESCESFLCVAVGDQCSGSCVSYSTAACGQPYTYRAVSCTWESGGAGTVCSAAVTGNPVGPQACN